MKTNIDFNNINDKLNSYIIGSSINMNKHFQDAEPFIDLIVTSPPYWDMKQYGEVDEQTGYGQTYPEYLSDIKKTFEGVYKYSKTSATLFVIIDTMKRNGKMVRLPDDLSNVLEDIGWVHQDTIIWDKGKTLPWSRKGQMRNVFEYILMFTKKDTINYKYNVDQIKTVDDLKEWWIDYPERYSPEGKVPSNIWEFVIPTQGSWGTKRDFGDNEFKHACPFPPEMMARIIKLSSDEGDVVFDPFAGTGVLFATARLLNRNFIGFDTNPDYKKVFEQVTIPLVNQKWEEIAQYYMEQEKLKKVMQDTIYKLRVLKFPKAIVKKMRNDLKDSLELQCDFSLIIADEKKLTNEDIERDRLGRIKYTFVWNDVDTVEEAMDLIMEISSKAPFSKYGLSVEIEIIGTKEFLENDKNNSENYFSYMNGNTNSFYNEDNLSYFKNILGTEIHKGYFDKEIPPILSSIKIQDSDYIDLKEP
ncbi:hypothetical protein BACPU_23490 [Bacillus pumilus]|nr:hypothetical protein BACPU_23490 [Bacillus pumilus]